MALPYVWTFWSLYANACAYLVKVILDGQGAFGAVIAGRQRYSPYIWIMD
jgi:hypothetical protein